MDLKLIRLFILGVFGMISVISSAQDVYQAEIGITGGGSYYLGEANSHLFKNTQPAYSGFFRYTFNTRLALKVELTNTNVVGVGFNNKILATDVTGEFNFFDLEKNEYKQFSKIFSPYIFAGIGMMNYSYKEDTTGSVSSKLTPSIPFGIGIKVKLGKRWNLNAQWTNRLLLADNMEGVSKLNNLNVLNGSNAFNNDLLSTFTIGISYDIWKRNCHCENSAVTKDSHKYKKKLN